MENNTLCNRHSLGVNNHTKMYVTYTRIYGWSDYGGESSYQPGYRLENMMWMTLLVYDYIIPGRKDIITKWKEPVFVNGDFNDIVANIHVVTNKEADCSLGEGLVKQYLEAKKISFRTEHYIREIRKRYDFSLEWNKTLLFIEFDGEQHFKSINRWGGKKGYLKRRQADIEKNEYCRNKGIPLLRIRFDQAYLIPNMIDDFLKNSEKYSQQFNTYLADDVYYSICQ